MKLRPVFSFDLPRSRNTPPCSRIKFHRLPNLNLLLLPLFLLLHFSPQISAIRKDASLQLKRNCRTTVQGRFFLADDNGYVCDAFSVDPLSRCCSEKREKYSCQGCNLTSQCCNSYEFCVSCCLNPAMTPKDLAVKVKIAKPVTAGNYPTVFDFCAGWCRHSSASVTIFLADIISCGENWHFLDFLIFQVHENAYLSEFHHCFSITSNISGISITGSSSTQLEPRLAGINIIVGRKGESCDSVCKSDGQSCVPNKLSLLNQCEVIQKYMRCKGACLSSIGADQPAEVVEDAPRYLNPGACLYTRTESMLSCDGSHTHTRRLCPCA